MRDTYFLRLLDQDGKEVNASTVIKVPGAQNYPFVGQTIDDTWLVTEVISDDGEERCLRVKRLDTERSATK